jgi:hypothetical protein
VLVLLLPERFWDPIRRRFNRRPLPTHADESDDLTKADV